MSVICKRGYLWPMAMVNSIMDWKRKKKSKKIFDINVKVSSKLIVSPFRCDVVTSPYKRKRTWKAACA